jgi:hypothetical protein
MTYLLLEDEDVEDATIDRVAQACVCLVAYDGDCACMLLCGDMDQ